MAHPPIDTGPVPARTYSLQTIFVVSVLLSAAMVLAVLAVSNPVVIALLVAGARVTQRLREEVRDARRQFPNQGERLCYCIPGTDRCLTI